MFANALAKQNITASKHVNLSMSGLLAFFFFGVGVSPGLLPLSNLIILALCLWSTWLPWMGLFGKDSILQNSRPQSSMLAHMPVSRQTTQQLDKKVSFVVK